MHEVISGTRSAVRRGAVLLLAVVAAAAVQAGAPAGASAQDRHGLRGDYYTSSAPGAFDFGELKATVVDPNIEFPDLEPTLQELTGRNDDVTVRWTGRVEPGFSETYTFSMIGDNGFRLWVDGRLVIDNWVDNWDIEQVGQPIALEAGRRYDIKVEYFEHVGGSNLRLRWQSASQPKEIVPPEAFYLPEGFNPPGPESASLAADGTTLTLDFADALGRVPAGAVDHFHVTVGGTEWPIRRAGGRSVFQAPEALTVQSLALEQGDPSTLVLTLSVPIPRQAGSAVRVGYDGEGGVTYADGRVLESFAHVPVANHSEYSITTRWADDVDPNAPLPDYPRPQMVRDRWQSLNGTWQFAPAAEGDAPPIGRDLGERIVVPFPVESRLSGVGRHEDRMWYRRTFTVPASWRSAGQRLLLHFDAVDWETTVYVNGRQVGTHKGGYDRFSVDVTDALRASGPQELVVGVFDPTDQGGQALGKQRLSPGGIFYTPVSGIWQTVWAEPVSAAHIDRLDMTPDVAGQALRLTVRASGASDQVAVVTARDGKRTVGAVSGPVGTELRVPVPDPKLWSPDRPFLYDLSVELKPAPGTGGPVDAVRSYFGMRTIGLDRSGGRTQIVLNGRPTFEMGPLDQGFWPDGIYTAPTDAALKYDLDQTKALGFNAVRKHVKVEPDRWYYWADKLGLLVWQDMPAMPNGRTPTTANREQFEIELRRMVDQHLDHPAIVMWVPFNEGWGQYDQARIADMIKTWDPSRLVDNMSGINCCGSVDGGNGDVMDFHIYPGPGTPGAPSATRASVLGEYGGLGLPVLGHTWAGGGWGYAVEPSADALTDHYVRMSERLRELRSCEGLSAAIYTQTTDVETELNGLMTYDRAVVKPRAADIRDANQAVIATAAGEPPSFPPGTPGLAGVGFWPFDEARGTVASDEAGDHDATLVNGATWTTGHSGSALQLSGAGQYADTGAGILDTTGNYSVAAWVKLDSLGGFATAVSQDGDSASGFFLQYSGADNRFAFSSTAGRALAPEPPEPGRWYHLVGVYDAAAGQLKLFVDGKLAGTVAQSCAEAATGHTVIGRAQFGGNQVDFWRGALDQVHVYDRALSDAEVQELHDSGR
jgi:Concanavalin A-like lectin/glucanases superfamily/PA14 domain/Glycosyl hydrolases family 2, sugar binding domain/Glycosyl hydrolases family 2, TIM barrel domain/Glycosyl hydrolases family 2